MRKQARRPSTDELRTVIERELNTYSGSCRVVSLERRPSPYRTSFPLEELRVGLDSGEVLPIIFKNLGEQAFHEPACLIKPVFLRNPLREIHVYRHFLAAARVGTPVCYGAVSDGQAGRYWLFLEHVTGRELYQVGEIAVWQSVARWLARLHAQFVEAGAVADGEESRHLLRYDEAFYRRWHERAVAFLHSDGRDRTDGGRRALAWLDVAYDGVIDCLLALPPTLIHGEFYASNVLVQEDGAELRVSPVDWEMAALGPGLIDLAALTTGRWTDDQRSAIALAYQDALLSTGTPCLSLSGFQTALDCCHLQVALQWLGWAPEWLPPIEHRHNWLDDILRLSARLQF